MISFSLAIITLNYFILSKKDKIMKIINDATRDLLKEEKEKLKGKNKQLKLNKNLKEIKALSSKEEDEKSKKLKEENDKLKEEFEKKENEKIKEENKKLKENEELKEENLNLRNENDNLKKLLKNLIIIIFISTDQKINNYPMKCQKTEKFVIYEQKLYEAFPEYKERNNHFICNV